MNSFVAIAYVPDTETRIKIGPDGKSLDESDVKWIVSPYDEYALEEALRIKEAKGAGTVRVVSVGPERAKTGLRECLARGEIVFIKLHSGFEFPVGLFRQRHSGKHASVFGFVAIRPA